MNMRIDTHAESKSNGVGGAPILKSAAMNLQELLAGTPATLPAGNAHAEVSTLAYSSRQVNDGAAFFAIHGEKTDGNLFVFDAIANGATAIISEMPRPWSAAWSEIFERAGRTPNSQIVSDQIAWVQTQDIRKTLAIASANFYRHPATSLELVGITGTNGKTTTSFLVDSILRAAGRTTGLFGTIEYRTPRGSVAASTTTPESLETAAFSGRRA